LINQLDSIANNHLKDIAMIANLLYLQTIYRRCEQQMIDIEYAFFLTPSDAFISYKLFARFLFL